MINYRKIELNDYRLNKKLDLTLIQIAKWHNLTPALWMPDFIPSNEDIQKTVQRIKQTKNQNLFLKIAEDENGQMQGFIWANKQEKPKDSLLIVSLYVTKAFRGQGIATKLKLLLEEWCRAQEIKTIQTTTHYTNHNMIALNVKLGYTPGMVHMTKTLD